jgi:hypothetical protein
MHKKLRISPTYLAVVSNPMHIAKCYCLLAYNLVYKIRISSFVVLFKFYCWFCEFCNVKVSAVMLTLSFQTRLQKLVIIAL